MKKVNKLAYEETVSPSPLPQSSNPCNLYITENLPLNQDIVAHQGTYQERKIACFTFSPG
jgi:hypothetical protein